MIIQRFFDRALEASAFTGIIILAVLLIRLLLRRCPKVFSYALWGFVLLRLIIPFVPYDQDGQMTVEVSNTSRNKKLTAVSIV